MKATEGIQVDVGSIDGAAVSITDGEDRIVAQVTRWPDIEPAQWQYVVSALAAVLNDASASASSLRAKARREVRDFTPEDGGAA